MKPPGFGLWCLLLFELSEASRACVWVPFLSLCFVGFVLFLCGEFWGNLFGCGFCLIHWRNWGLAMFRVSLKISSYIKWAVISLC